MPVVVRILQSDLALARSDARVDEITSQDGRGDQLGRLRRDRRAPSGSSSASAGSTSPSTCRVRISSCATADPSKRPRAAIVGPGLAAGAGGHRGRRDGRHNGPMILVPAEVVGRRRRLGRAPSSPRSCSRRSCRGAFVAAWLTLAARGRRGGRAWWCSSPWASRTASSSGSSRRPAASLLLVLLVAARAARRGRLTTLARRVGRIPDMQLALELFYRRAARAGLARDRVHLRRRALQPLPGAALTRASPDGFR